MIINRGDSDRSGGIPEYQPSNLPIAGSSGLEGVTCLIEAGDVGSQIIGWRNAPNPVGASGPSGGCSIGFPVNRGGL